MSTLQCPWFCVKFDCSLSQWRDVTSGSIINNRWPLTAGRIEKTILQQKPESAKIAIEMQAFQKTDRWIFSLTSLSVYIYYNQGKIDKANG